MYWIAPLWPVPQLGLGHREQILHVANDIEYLNRIDISRERERESERERAREREGERDRVYDSVELKI